MTMVLTAPPIAWLVFAVPGWLWKSALEPLLDDLAHRVAGQLVEVVDLAGALVGRELAGHVVDQLALRRALVAVGDDPGDDPLAEVRVGRAGDGRLEHAGVLEQRDLDLPRADLVAAGLDQVGRAPADDPPVAVRRAGADVAGEEPPVAHRLCGGVGPVQV